jgi:hypothetical protein
MNALQLMRKARLEVDGIRSGGATSALWSDEEVLDALNTAMDSAARIIRLSDSDILTKTLKSTASAVDLISESYVPATSLAIVAGTTEYTMPPDIVSVVTIRPLTSGYEGIRFRPSKSYSKGFVDQQVLTDDDLGSVNGSDSTFYYAVLGTRTLRIAPEPQDSFDIELVYRYRPARLQNHTTGTVSITQGLTALTGAGTAWLADGVRTPAELFTSASPTVSLSTVYPAIASITAAGTATMARTWAPATLAASAYTISMVPVLPPEHHAWLAQMAGALLLRKVSIELSDNARKALEAQLMSEVTPEVTVRQAQESLPVDPYEIP